jgi:hypothetical protein
MQTDMEHLEDRAVRRTRTLLRIAVVGVWLVGLVLAIRSGWSPPGLRSDPSTPWPYPFAEVLIVIAQVTVVSACFYDFLRPQATASFWARVARATGLAVAMLFWTTWNSATDQPGYAYVPGAYVFIITVALLVTLLVLVVIRLFSRSGHAA